MENELSSSGGSSLEYLNGQWESLYPDNIKIRDIDEKFPDDIANLIDQMHQDRNSPGPVLDNSNHSPQPDNELCEQLPETIHDLAVQISQGQDALGRQLDDAVHYDDSDFRAGDYINDYLLPSLGLVGHVDLTPRVPTPEKSALISASGKVPARIPDLLCGYKFEPELSQQRTPVLSTGIELLANHMLLHCPFLVIRFMDEVCSEIECTHSQDVAGKCASDSTVCIELTERLNRGNQEDHSPLINRVAFSIAMSATRAKISITWKHDDEYSVCTIGTFLLYNPQQYHDFCKYSRNIVDWGMGERLKEIQESVGFLQNVGFHQDTAE
ncbi:hypothetical protein BKA56DRAFT_676385 [Ilyonectria sp. MPI-CAGE-AT-0026]|nr:hypothetical protein BKA56DRAFT_676385 [Ilyonectria sp. MPI-CAGE-AT-0026]